MRKVLLLEPFYTGSHQSWAEGWQRFSQHEVKILSLSGRHWKWRMHAGAVALSQQFLVSDFQPDLIVATDMLDFATFLGLVRSSIEETPTAIYFHENQITYPWSAADPDIKLKRDHQYGFKNYTSALVADQVFFNSDYHRHSFLNALPNFLTQFPDYQGIENVELIKKKSQTLHLGVDLQRFDGIEKSSKLAVPLLVWNHRWEYDKNPEDFFEVLFQLKKEEIAFKVAILGEQYRNTPAIFQEAKEVLSDEIVQFGKVDQFEEYAQWLWQADILPVSNHQDFFGQSVVEAIYCDCFPILPDRLAYPEHVPSALQNQHFYRTNEGFY
ncbi:MAG: DUF3524 domain-containing protein, partial [Bacteroidota bacterium]